MLAVLRFIIGQVVTTLIEQLPTFIAAIQKMRAKNSAETARAQDGQKIDDFVKRSSKDGIKP